MKKRVLIFSKLEDDVNIELQKQTIEAQHYHVFTVMMMIAYCIISSASSLLTQEVTGLIWETKTHETKT
jgi:hypothetical protein